MRTWKMCCCLNILSKIIQNKHIDIRGIGIFVYNEKILRGKQTFLLWYFFGFCCSLRIV